MDKQQFRQTGISLVEVLLVIAIIGLLISLALPAIQAARESSRRALCTSNLRQFGVALSTHESQFKRFPAAVTVKLKGPLGRNPEIKAYNFLTELLPFIEEESLASSYQRDVVFFAPENAQAIATPLSIALCPSTPVRDTPISFSFMPSLIIKSTDDMIVTAVLDSLDSRYSATFLGAISDYTVAAHADGSLATRLGYEAEDSVQELPSMFPLPKSDTLLSRLTPLLITSGEVQLGERMSAAQITDGLSRTFAMFEVAGKPQHWRQGLRTPVGEPLPNAWADPRIAIKIRPSERADSENLINVDNNDHAYSFHAGGANFVFADAHVEFLDETIAPRLLLSLMTPAEGDEANR